MLVQAGTIFLKRGGHSASNETTEHMTWSLSRRQPVISFPEGATSEGRTVRSFYGRLYQSAVRTQGVVQAVAIAYLHASGVHPRVPFVGDDDLVRHLWRLLNEDRIDARLVFCTPLPATGRERRTLAARSRMQILETLGLLPGTAQAGR
jgi:1-acyl-sn-glycerol-3-phosphate acyltransferase